MDGGQHLEQAAYDQVREERLALIGIQVLRFWNDAVLEHLDDVLREIGMCMAERL